MAIYKHNRYITGLVCAVVLSFNGPAYADAARELEIIRGHACYGAMENDFDTFIRDLKADGLDLPNAQIYRQIECGSSNYILQNTLLPNSIVFLQKYVVGTYKKFGKEEVAKIISTPDRNFGFTLLEEAIIKDKCQNTSNSDTSTIIEYLKKVGGKTRPNFISVCKKHREKYD